MKKSLLILILCCAFSFYMKAQEVGEVPLMKYSKEAKLNVFYDKANDEYVPRSIYVARHGRKNLKALEGEYKKQKFIYGKNGLKALEAADNQRRKENNLEDRIVRLKSLYKPTVRLKPGNMIAGTSLIGVSLSTYLVSNTMINREISKSEDAEKIRKLNKTNRVIGYSAASLSLTGVILALTGIKKEYSQGIPIASNLYLSDKNKEIGFSFVF